MTRHLTVVSSCLAGVPCRYDGRAKPSVEIVAAVAAGDAVPLCAEVAGGMDTPRPAAEIRGGDGADVLAGRAHVVDVTGADVTHAFVAGARTVAARAVELGATEAVLQERSPSCGCGAVYDGTFSGVLVPGDGVTAAALREAGIAVRGVRGSHPAP